MRHSAPTSFLATGVAVALAVALVGAQAPAGAAAGGAPAAPQGGRGGGGRLGGGGFAAPTKAPSELRAIPAETTASKVKDPNWKAPRLSWGHPDLEGIWTSDDMRGIPTSRLPAQGTRESLTPEEFARRAGGDEASRDAFQTALSARSGRPAPRFCPTSVVAALAMPAMPRAAPTMMPAETTERTKVRAMLLIISEFSCVSWLFSFCAAAFRR